MTVFLFFYFFFFNDTATTEIYTLSLHDALPIRRVTSIASAETMSMPMPTSLNCCWMIGMYASDRKSTRLNSSHDQISYAVFCLKKKNTKKTNVDQARPKPKKKKNK